MRTYIKYLFVSTECLKSCTLRNNILIGNKHKTSSIIILQAKTKGVF